MCIIQFGRVCRRKRAHDYLSQFTSGYYNYGLRPLTKIVIEDDLV